MVHMPTGIVQHSRNHAVAIPTVSPRELDDIIGQPFFIGMGTRYLTLGRSVLTKCLTGPAFRYAEGLADVVNA
jgi:hypothetical protein